MKYLFFIKILTIIFLTWMPKCYRDECISYKTLGLKRNNNLSRDLSTHRILARHIEQNKLKNTELKNMIPHNYEKYKLDNKEDHLSTYVHLKKGSPNNLDAYMNEYKKRYSKRKGLSKLDCYCEHKIFKSFDKIHKHIENMNSTRGILKKLIYNKYRLRILLLFLFPLIGIIIPVLNEFGIGDKITTCPETSHNSNGCYYSILYKIEQEVPLSNICIALYCIYIIIVFSACIYIIKKKKKYNNLKEGKNKMKSM
ncbi:Plasmodium exported protein, unknown function [Plasmodium vivax]|uniref:Variable surface protein n=1 Tax=Plasmodium vivax TaxID=5855 RepID=A0A1G4ECJ3_PLAVI|nr:Plasmodium exported protein, unknown function [Plasmodium vivax]VVA00315.1 Plasmodium exported protein, unknown function [Plasmodium vivax]